MAEGRACARRCRGRRRGARRRVLGAHPTAAALHCRPPARRSAAVPAARLGAGPAAAVRHALLLRILRSPAATHPCRGGAAAGRRGRSAGGGPAGLLLLHVPQLPALGAAAVRAARPAAAAHLARSRGPSRAASRTAGGERLPQPGQQVPDVASLEPALGPLLGASEDLPALLAAGTIDDIILADGGDSWQTRLIDRLAGTRPDHTNVLLLPGPFESLIGRMRYRWVHDLPLIEVMRETEWRINWPLKRLQDLVGGTLLLFATLPALAACALAVRLTSPGPILYRQLRVGRDQRPFTLWKLRTMRIDAEAESGEDRP